MAQPNVYKEHRVARMATRLQRVLERLAGVEPERGVPLLPAQVNLECLTLRQQLESWVYHEKQREWILEVEGAYEEV